MAAVRAAVTAAGVLTVVLVVVARQVVQVVDVAVDVAAVQVEAVAEAVDAWVAMGMQAATAAQVLPPVGSRRSNQTPAEMEVARPTMPTTIATVHHPQE